MPEDQRDGRKPDAVPGSGDAAQNDDGQLIPEQFRRYAKLGKVILSEGFGVISRGGRTAFLVDYTGTPEELTDVSQEIHLTIVLPDAPDMITAMMSEIIAQWPEVAREIIGMADAISAVQLATASDIEKDARKIIEWCRWHSLYKDPRSLEILIGQLRETASGADNIRAMVALGFTPKEGATDAP